MEERELVKIVSDSPAHPDGYYTQFKDAMKPGDVIFKDKPFVASNDFGEAVRLRAMNLKALQAMAEKAEIPDYLTMDKTALVNALLK